MSDQDFDSRLLDLFYGELPPDEARALEAEIAGDTAMRETLAGWEAVRAAVKDLPAPEPDPQVHYTLLRAAREAVAPAEPKGLWAWLSKLAVSPIFAGVAVLSLAVGAVFFMQSENSESSGRFDDVAHTPKPTAQAPITAAPESSLQFRTPGAKQDAPADKTKKAYIDGERKSAIKTLDPTAKGEMRPSPDFATGRGESGAADAFGGAAERLSDDERAAARDARKDRDGRADDSVSKRTTEKSKLAKNERAKTKPRRPKASKKRGRTYQPPKAPRATARPAPRKSPETVDSKAKAKKVASADARQAAPVAPTSSDLLEDQAAFEGKAQGDAAKPVRERNQPETANFAPPPPADAPDEPAEREESLKLEEEELVASKGKDSTERRTKTKAPPRTPAAEPAVAAPVVADVVKADAENDLDDAAPVAPTRGGGGVPMAGNVAVGGVADDATVGDALEEPATRTATAAAPAQRASGRRRAESGGDIARAAPAVPPELQAARAARSRGDHRSAVGAYTRYFERHRGHNEFSRSLFEAAASYEALGDVGKALRMYGLIPASAGSWYTRAQARIGALRAVRNTPPPSNAGANADDGDDESNQVRPMPMPPEVDPPRR